MTNFYKDVDSYTKEVADSAVVPEPLAELEGFEVFDSPEELVSTTYEIIDATSNYLSTFDISVDKDILFNSIKFYRCSDPTYASSIFDHMSGNVYIFEGDAVNEETKKYDPEKYGIALAHEIGHRYGAAFAEGELPERATAIAFTNMDKSSRSIVWLTECVTILISYKIRNTGKMDLGGFDIHKYAPKFAVDYYYPRYFALKENIANNFLADQIKDGDKFDIANVTQMLTGNNTITLADIQKEINSEDFFINAQFNRGYHTALAYILFCAYSNKPATDDRYTNMWEQLMEDQGLFASGPLNLSL